MTLLAAAVLLFNGFFDLLVFSLANLSMQRFHPVVLKLQHRS